MREFKGNVQKIRESLEEKLKSLKNFFIEPESRNITEDKKEREANISILESCYRLDVHKGRVGIESEGGNELDFKIPKKNGEGIICSTKGVNPSVILGREAIIKSDEDFQGVNFNVDLRGEEVLFEPSGKRGMLLNLLERMSLGPSSKIYRVLARPTHNRGASFNVNGVTGKVEVDTPENKNLLAKIGAHGTTLSSIDSSNPIVSLERRIGLITPEGGLSLRFKRDGTNELNHQEDLVTLIEAYRSFVLNTPEGGLNLEVKEDGTYEIVPSENPITSLMVGMKSEVVTPEGTGLDIFLFPHVTEIGPNEDSGTYIKADRKFEVLASKDRGILTRYSKESIEIGPTLYLGARILVDMEVYVIASENNGLCTEYGKEGINKMQPSSTGDYVKIGRKVRVTPEGRGLRMRFSEGGTELEPTSKPGAHVEVGKVAEVSASGNGGLCIEYGKEGINKMHPSSTGDYVKIGRKVGVTPEGRDLLFELNKNGTNELSPKNRSGTSIKTGRRIGVDTFEDKSLAAEFGESEVILEPTDRSDVPIKLGRKAGIKPKKGWGLGLWWDTMRNELGVEPTKNRKTLFRTAGGLLDLKNSIFTPINGDGSFDLNALKWKKKLLKGLSLILLGGALVGGGWGLTSKYIMNNDEEISLRQSSSQRFDSIEELVEANGIDIYHEGAFDRWTDLRYDILTLQGLCEKETYVTDIITGRHFLVRSEGSISNVVNTNRDYEREKREQEPIELSPEALMNQDLRINHGGDYVLPIREGEQGYPFEFNCNGSDDDIEQAVERYLSGRIPPNQWWPEAGLENLELPFSSGFEGIYRDFVDDEGNPTLPQEIVSLLKSKALVESRFISDAVSSSGAMGILQLSEDTLISCGVERENYFSIPYQIRCAYTHYQDKIGEFKGLLGDVRASDEDKEKLALYLTMQAHRSGEDNIRGILEKPESRGVLEELLSENRSPQEAVHGLTVLNYGFGTSPYRIGENSITYIPDIFVAQGILPEDEQRP